MDTSTVEKIYWSILFGLLGVSFLQITGLSFYNILIIVILAISVIIVIYFVVILVRDENGDNIFDHVKNSVETSKLNIMSEKVWGIYPKELELKNLDDLQKYKLCSDIFGSKEYSALKDNALFKHRLRSMSKNIHPTVDLKQYVSSEESSNSSDEYIDIPEESIIEPAIPESITLNEIDPVLAESIFDFEKIEPEDELDVDEVDEKN